MISTKMLYAEDDKSVVEFVKVLFKKNNILDVVFAQNLGEGLIARWGSYPTKTQSFLLSHFLSFFSEPFLVWCCSICKWKKICGDIK